MPHHPPLRRHQEIPHSGVFRGDLEDERPTQIIEPIIEAAPSLPAPHSMEEIHTSPDPKVGLGRRAVRLGIHEAFHTVKEEVPTPLEQQKTESLTATRKKLQGLSWEAAKKLQHLLLQQSPSPWLMERLGFNEQDQEKLARDAEWATEFVDRLSRKEQGERVVSDELLQNFLEWHNHALSGKQLEMDSRIETLKGAFINKFAESLRLGWVPISAAENLKRVAGTRVIVDDGLETTLTGRLGMAPQEKTGRRKVILAPILADTQRTLDHELTHIVDGRNPETKPDTNPRDYALYRLFGQGKGGKEVNERLTEHFVSSINRGNVDITDPHHPLRSDAAHKAGGELLHSLATSGLKKVDIRHFLAAYFENGSKEELLKDPHSAQSVLAKELREAFPFDVIREVNSFGKKTNIEKYAKKLQKRVRRYKLRRAVFGSN